MASTSGGITLEYLMYYGLLTTSIGGFVKLGKSLEALNKGDQKNATTSTIAVVAPTISTLGLMGCQDYRLNKQEQAMTTSAYIEQMSDEDLAEALIQIGELEEKQESVEDVKVL